MNITRLAVTADPGGALPSRFSAHFASAAITLQDRFINDLKSLIWLIWCSFSLVSAAHATSVPSVTFEWDPVLGSEITDYQLSYGTSPGIYTNVIDVGTNLAASVPGLVWGTTYYFAVSAVNTAGLKSAYSNEVSYFAEFTDTLPTNTWTVQYPEAGTSANFSIASAFDSNPNTFWQAAPAVGGLPPKPHDIQINLGSVQSLAGFRYLPRQDSSTIGNIGRYEFFLSQDGVNWGLPVASGVFSSTNDIKEVAFTAQDAQYVMLRSLSDVNGGNDCAVAELSLIMGPPANQPPVAVSCTLFAEKNMALPVQLAASDFEGSPLVFSLVDAPLHGTLSGTAPSLTYWPAADFTGSDSFTFRANDGTSYSATTTASINVVAVARLPQTGWTLKYADSVETQGGLATYAFDGNPSTTWHTQFTTNSPPPPHEIQIDLGASQNVAGFCYLPRQDSYTTGNIDQFEFYVSVDGINWGSPVATGKLANTKTEKEILFTTKTGRFVRLRALSEVDGKPYTCMAEFSVLTGKLANQAPTATSQSLTTAEDTSLQITLSGADLENNALNFSLIDSPAHGQLSGIAPNLTYLPNAGFSGGDSFTFCTNDGTLNSTTATVSISVTQTPPPTGMNLISRNGWTLNYVDSEEAGVNSAVYAFDGNNSTFWQTQWKNNAPPPPHEIQINLGSVQTIGGFRYLPRQDGWNTGNVVDYEFYVSMDGVNWGTPVAIGMFDNSKFEKQAISTAKNGQFIRLRSLTDASGNVYTNCAEISLLSGTLNRAPLATSASLTSPEDAPLKITLAGSDPDGSALTYSVSSSPSHGKLTGTAPDLTYLPDANYNGSDQFTFRTNDGALNSELATVSITITPVDEVVVNVAPVFPVSPIVASATEDQIFSGQLAATDGNPGDALTYSKLSGPTWLSISPSGEMSGTPLNSDVGNNTFSVQVNDPSNASATATLTIAVANTNDAPAFKVTSMTLPSGLETNAYTGQTLANSATDPDRGDTITYSKATGLAWLNISSTGVISGIPPVGSRGLQQFTARATDAAGAYVEIPLQIQILENSLPLPWNADRIGTTLLGPAKYSSGNYTIAGAGILGTTQDAGNFGWQTLSGDGQITAKVKKIDPIGSTPLIGLMIRESLASNARQAFIGVSDDANFRWIRRTNTGGSISKNFIKNAAPTSIWLRIARKGTTITSFRSADGVTWTKIGSVTISLPKNCYVGMCVSSGTNADLNNSVFSNVSVTP